MHPMITMPPEVVTVVSLVCAVAGFLNIIYTRLEPFFKKILFTSNVIPNCHIIVR